WRKYGRSLGARDSPGQTGFEIRNGGGFSDIATKWGLGLLDKAGCINLNTNLDKQLCQDPVGKVAKERNPHNECNSQIHSVFRKTSWQNCSDAQFAAIRPALLLASAWLDEPATLCFFYATSTPETMITFEDPKLGTCKRLNIPSYLTPEQQNLTVERLFQMAVYTSFFWENSEALARMRAFAYCQTLGGEYEALLLCWQGQSGVVDDDIESYEAVLRKMMEAANILDSHKPSPHHLQSAYLRTTFLLVQDMIHELAHAFRYAYFAAHRKPDGSKILEPWVADERYNELGIAAQKYIFGGTPFLITSHDTSEKYGYH
ncbi:hypothetical protein E4T47_06813, partial [Aureobasidium subglaciale]